jgi:predicted DNA-binding transcriptional regulator AlpA
MTTEFLRPTSAAARFDLSRRTLSRLASTDPSFPKPARISRRLILFKVSELDHYFTRKKQGPRAPAKEEQHAV